MSDNADLARRIAEIPDADGNEDIGDIAPAEGVKGEDRTTTTFCEKISLKKSKGKVFGRFHPSKSIACTVKGFQSVIDEAAIRSIEDVGKCANKLVITKIVYE